MAESFAAWLREEVAPRAAKLAGKLKSVENYDSYECRSRNRVPGAKISRACPWQRRSTCAPSTSPTAAAWN